MIAAVAIEPSPNLRSTTGFTAGAKILVGGESRIITSVDTAATAATKGFINVSTGPWLDFPAGTTNLPVHSAEGLAVGERISIDLGGNTEIATVTAVGKAATQTTLAASATPGATNIKLAALADVSAGDTLTIGTGQRMEQAVVASVGTAGPEGYRRRSIGRYPDGHDDDSLCTDFMVQPATTLPEGAAPGVSNIKVAGVAGFAPGQTVMIGSGPAGEAAVIASVGTAGSTRLNAATQVGDTSLPVAATAGFVAGQSITIGSGANQETATIAQVQGGRGGGRITMTMPLTIGHAANAPLAGSGITLTTPIGREHPRGAAVTADVPTPGAANRYSNPRAVR